LLLGIIHVLTPTLQINDMTFQPQTTTIPALLPFTIIVVTAPKGTKGKNGMKRSSRMSGLDDVSLMRVLPAVFGYPQFVVM
jgi:hypothetical protein